MRRVRLVGAVGLVACSVIGASSLASQYSAIDAVVADICNRRIVLLGEDANHGSGATLAIKVQLVQRLITECHYSAVLFESQFYDFVDLEHAVAGRTASPALVTETIGGLWSKARETGELADVLFEQSKAGRVTLGGLDPQVGGATQRFTQQRLPKVLASQLSGARAAECEAEFSRLTNYRYDDSIAYDAATRNRLRGCATDVERALAQRLRGPNELEVSQMVRNLVQYLDMSDGNAFSVRDRAMFDNLRWYLARLPNDAKVIVWCATVHAIKQPTANATNVPLGALVHTEFGERAAAIGFSALTGSFGRPGRSATPLDAAPPSSLEGRALAGAVGDAVYLDRPALARIGAVVGRALNYRKGEVMDWSTVLDGLVVLRQERAQQP